MTTVRAAKGIATTPSHSYRSCFSMYCQSSALVDALGDWAIFTHLEFGVVFAGPVPSGALRCSGLRL